MKNFSYKSGTYLLAVFIFSFLILLTTTSVAVAQSEAPSESDWSDIIAEIDSMGESVEGIEVPFLEATSIELENDKYRPGEIVKGLVSVRNSGTIFADNIIPIVSLIGDYKGPIHSTVYDVDNNNKKVEIAPGETKIIAFSYTLPSVFQSNDLGIQVEFYTETSLRQDFVSTKFNAIGESEGIDLEYSALLLRGNGYGIRMTPAVYPGDDFYLDLKFYTDEEVVVVPKIDIYSFSSATGEKNNSYSYNNETLKKGLNNLSLKIDNLSQAGMNEGVLKIEDTEGNEIAPPVMFLFMFMGDGTPFMIRNITAQDEVSAKGIKDFTVSYTLGAADIDLILFDDSVYVENNSEITEEDEGEEDITLPDAPDYSDVMVEIEVTDESGETVAVGEVGVSDKTDFSIVVPVDVGGVVSGKYSVTARAIDSDGNILGFYTKDMDIETGKDVDNSLIINIIAVAVLAFIVVILALVRLKVSKHKKEDNININNDNI
ncbi:hypothetical protein N9L18_01120 [Candidatus Pacebacteria bacterium]|nr:hypothetical protein [Candidatus Paceibacterota bacterium]